MLFGGLIPAVTVFYHQLNHPVDHIYPAYLVYKDCGESLQGFALLASFLVQAYMSLQGFFAILITDVLPLLLSIGYRDAFAHLNERVLSDCCDRTERIMIMIRDLTSDTELDKNVTCMTSKPDALFSSYSQLRFQIPSIPGAVVDPSAIAAIVSGRRSVVAPQKVSSPRQKAPAIMRAIMKKHRGVQRCLHMFNDTFKLYIMLFVLQVKVQTCVTS